MSDTTPWIKASASDSSGSCVEQRRHAGHVEVRDTKAHGKGPVLQLSASGYAAWVRGAQSGEFDRLS